MCVSGGREALKFYGLCSSGLLRSVGWSVTDVSGQHMGSILKGRDVLDIWTLDDGTDMLPETSVADQSALQRDPQKRRSQSLCGEILNLT
jgi:hypothetical protein